MDVEANKDDLSVEDGKLIVFSGIKYTVNKRLQGFYKWQKRDPGGPQHPILNGASGALRPGRLTFILGPSGAGKTTLLKILAGRKKTGVKGCLIGSGKNAVLVAQEVTLIDSLTAKETLEFAASLKLPSASRREKCYAMDSVSQQLGIYEVLNTRAGSLSGGERRRLNIACELLTDPPILLLDEPTSGLDSVSSMSVAQALRSLAASGRTVACVVHQPSSRLFASADDVILLASGRTMYAGAVTELPAALGRAGYVCPQYYNLADFLLEVAMCEPAGNPMILEKEAVVYANEMKKLAQNDYLDANGKDISTEGEALLKTQGSQHQGYAASVGQQLKALLWRGLIGALRDVHLTKIRLVAHFLVALLLGALYNGAGADANRMMSNTGCIFFFLLFLYFSNAMPTIHTFPSEANVVLREHLNRWYWLSTYCASKIIVDLPIQLLCSTVFVLPAWYLTSQPLEPFRMGLAWLICILITILAQTFGLVVGAACGVKLGLFVIPAANIPMLMFSEFFIPYAEMPVYLRPFSLISYFRYAYNALMQATYGVQRETLRCNKEFCMFRNPARYLNYLGLNGNYIEDIVVLVTWIVLLQISLICVLALRVYKARR